MRGGYQIIDFQKIALTDSNTKVDGVYKAIQDNPLKVLQLNNINLNGTLKDDVFTTATKGTNKYTFDVYDGILTVTSADNVRWVSHDTIQTVISNIDDLQSDVADLQTDVEPITYNNAGAHNCIYRGKNLGTSVTDDQWAAISAGTFEDLYIGDYWVINNTTYRIAAFDYYYLTGDTSFTSHHAVIVPDTPLYDAKMNETNTTEGAYVGSAMYTTHLATAKTTIQTDFGSTHVLSHRQYLKNAVTDGYESAGAWYDSIVELMNEQNVYGSKIFANCIQGTNFATQQTIDKSQYPLFAFNTSIISSCRSWWWLRDVANASAFANVYSEGRATYSYAPGSGGVRPAFCIGVAST